jgi:cell division protein FtsB
LFFSFKHENNYFVTNDKPLGTRHRRAPAGALKTVTINVEENSLDIVNLYERLEKLEKENQKLKEEISSMKKK